MSQVREAVQKLGKGALVEVNSGLVEVADHMVNVKMSVEMNTKMNIKMNV